MLPDFTGVAYRALGGKEEVRGHDSNCGSCFARAHVSACLCVRVCVRVRVCVHVRVRVHVYVRVRVRVRVQLQL